MRGFLVLGFGMVVVLGVVRAVKRKGSGTNLGVWFCRCCTHLHAFCAWCRHVEGRKEMVLRQERFSYCVTFPESGTPYAEFAGQ